MILVFKNPSEATRWVYCEESMYARLKPLWEPDDGYSSSAQAVAAAKREGAGVQVKVRSDL